MLAAIGTGTAAAQPSQTYGIKSEPLSAALKDFALKTGKDVVFDPSIAAGKTSPGVQIAASDDAALSQLLAGSNLTYARTSSGNFVVEASSKNAQAAPANGAATQDNSTSQVGFESVVVTAQKRSERLLDTPQSVTVLSSSQLNDMGATQFRDFANTVPGLSYATAGAGTTQITLRGITTGFDVGPTVGIYIDDVPYGSSSAFAQGGQARFDEGLFDIDRIEVLRGPQGTLYGASTMGGLLKYVTTLPDTQDFGGDVRTGLSGTENGGINYDVGGSLNIPLIPDQLAVRASGFESHDGGYIRNIATGQDNVNRSDVYGGRLDFLFTPIDALTIRLTGVLQDINRDGEATVDYTSTGTPVYGGLEQNRPFTEPFEQRFRLVSGEVKYDFGGVTATSISSYQTTSLSTDWDISAVYVPLLGSFGFGPYSAVSDTDNSATSKYTEELRLASDAAGPVDWIVGGFYTYENSRYHENFNLRDLTGAAAPNTLYAFDGLSNYEEEAVYGNLTWHLTDKLSATGGIRYAYDDQLYTQIGSGAFISSRPPAPSNEGVVTYLGDVRYQFDSNSTAYLRYATGYRPGGPNISANDPTTGKPLGSPTFGADSLSSYEGGYKAQTDDGRYGVDLSGYYIQWSNIQVLTSVDGFALRANAPGATVRGAELALTAKPIDRLNLTGSVSYQDPHLSEAAPAISGAKGERLPNVPHFSASVDADYVVYEEGVRPTVGASLQYVGDRTASFNASVAYPQYHLPQYTTVNLRTGFTIDRQASSPFDIQLYVHNLLDTRGQLSDMLPQFGNRIGIEQPRTVGVQVSTKF